MRSSKKTTVGIACASLVTILISGCGQDTSSGDHLTDVTFGSATTRVTPAQATYTSLPVGLGYWEEEGLNVEVLGLSGSATVVQAIDSGQIDLGTTGAGPLIASSTQNSGIKGFYDNVTKNFAVPAVPVDSEIESVSDFEGKTVGVQSLDSSTVDLIKAMARAEGVDPESMTFLNIGDGAPAAQFVKNGEVDIVGLSDSAQSLMVNMGIDLRIVASDEYLNMGFNYPLAAKAEFINSDRETLIKFARGVAKSQVFMETNPEAAVRINWEVYPESKPAGVSDEEAMAQAMTILEKRLSYVEAIDGIYGFATEESVQAQIDLMPHVEGVAVEDVWTADLVQEINNFDTELIREQARNY